MNELEQIEINFDEKENTDSKITDSFKAIIENNQKLVDNVTNLTKKVMTTIDNKTESKDESELSKIESKIQELRKIKLEAMNNLEHDKVLEIDELLQDLRLKQKELKSKPQSPEPDTELIEAVEQFRQEYSWYDEDPIMEAAMNRVDAINASSGKWKNKPVIERLRAGAEIVERRFSLSKEEDKFDKKLNKMYNQVENKSYSSRGRQVKVPAIHKTLSEGFGIPLEDIIKEMEK